jgi:hypothetical protein
MKLKCRYRTLLPAGHTAIDLLLLCAWIWHAVVVLNPENARSRPGNALAAYARSESIGWSPSTVCRDPDSRFALILTGTVPAGIISSSIRPEAGWQTRHRLWDPVWFSIHEAAALLLWFLIGAWLDSRRSRLARLMGAYLAGRIVLALLAIAIPGNCWVPLQLLFWLGLAVYGALWASRRLLQAARALGSA